MSSSSDDDEMFVLWWYRKRRMTKRQFWVHPENAKHDDNIGPKELSASLPNFKARYKMNQDTFRLLLNYVSPVISKRDTFSREAINAEERLLITLRFLATGCSFLNLSQFYKRGISTIAHMVRECAEAIWSCLQPLYMPVPTENMWKLIECQYAKTFKLPNCIGSIGGRYLPVNNFRRKNKKFYNHRGFFTAILLACSDANGLFVTIDARAAEGYNNGAVFCTSAVQRLLNDDIINVPEPKPMPNEEECFPYYFVASEDFPLKKNIIRPFHKRVLDEEKVNFNKTILKGQHNVERAFDMMVSKFEIFKQQIRCQEETSLSIIKAACVLHNFIEIVENRVETPKIFENFCCTHQPPCNNNTIYKSKTANKIRDDLKAHMLRHRKDSPQQDDNR